MNLIMSGNQLYLLAIKNLLTRLFPAKDIEARLTVDLGRHRSPQFALHLDMSKEEAAQEEGKTILDLTWRVKGVDHCDITLLLNWSKGIQPEEVGRILRSLGEDGKETMVARLEARVGRSA